MDEDGLSLRDRAFLARIMASAEYRYYRARSARVQAEMRAAHEASGIVVGGIYRSHFGHAGIETVTVVVERWVPIDCGGPWYLCRMEGVTDRDWRDGGAVRLGKELLRP